MQKNVKDIAVTFFEHIMKDYDVSWETDSTLQAFQISLVRTNLVLKTSFHNAIARTSYG